MSKERPILFSGEMVRAILDGRKTQTRRVVKPQPTGDPFPLPHCPYGQPGDSLWVRETWAIVYQNGTAYQTDYGMEHESWIESWNRPLSELETSNRPPGGWMIEYKADKEVDVKWRPSIYMPRWASRITLRVVDVRVERVQEISEDDAQAEGCNGSRCDHAYRDEHGCTDCYGTGWLWTPQLEYMDLWNSINARRGFGWEVNPLVWVVEFEKVTP